MTDRTQSSREPPLPSSAAFPAPGRVLASCLLVACLLGAAYAATQYYRHWVAPGLVAKQSAVATVDAAPPRLPADAQAILNPRGLVRQFDLDAEANLPTMWSSLQLLAAAGLLAAIWRHHRAAGTPMSRLWGLLALGFVALAVDEVVSLHNQMYVPAAGDEVRKARGVFYYSWVVPALGLVAVVGAMYARFVWRLPWRTRVLFALAGAGFVGSAVGGEMLMGLLISEGAAGRRIVAIGTIALEELGEMTAIAVFLYGLLDYMRRNGIALTLGYPAADARSTAASADELHAAASLPLRPRIPVPLPGTRAA